jgi:hypothetical protein
MDLVKRYGIVDYPQPGGGCMLTKEGFVSKLREVLRSYPRAGSREMELLKWGRHFRLPEGTICIIGRHQSDNEKLEALAGEEDILLRVMDYPGPTGLIMGPVHSDKDQNLAALIVTAYSDAPRTESIRVERKYKGNIKITRETNKDRDLFKDYQI